MADTADVQSEQCKSMPHIFGEITPRVSTGLLFKARLVRKLTFQWIGRDGRLKRGGGARKIT
jgi:hypothetical protein